MEAEPEPRISREEIYHKLTERCIEEDPALSAKIEAILRKPKVQEWVIELPTIPDLLLTMLGSFEDLEWMVTKEFIWEYWSKAMVEEEKSHPEIDAISDMSDLERYAARQGGYDPKCFPIQSLAQLAERAEWCQGRGRF